MRLRPSLGQASGHVDNTATRDYEGPPQNPQPQHSISGDAWTHLSRPWEGQGCTGPQGPFVPSPSARL